jgi:ABC-type dipeptide/oligopeptide/nickel transport system ATPase component
MNTLLEVRDLKVDFHLDDQIISAVDGVNFDVKINETVVLAGESGSGKTVTALALTRILPVNAKIISGQVNFAGRKLFDLDEEGLIKIRGKEIAYIFQEPVSFLNPVYTIGDQISEIIMLRSKMEKNRAYTETLRLLGEVKITDPERVFFSYPHQLSGGLNQRAFIAMSLASEPRLLIADEPTTSLDVTIEKEILELLCELKQKLDFSLLFITHNLSIAKKIAQRIFVMYKGKIVEQQDTEKIFKSPIHFHTKELIAAYEKIGRV